MAVITFSTLDGEVVSESRVGTRRDFLPDPLGSTAALLDSSQTKTDTWAYWPYGEERARTGATPTPFQFVGTLGYYEDSADRVYVRARSYRSGLGRWMTVDPLWPGESAYGYVSGNPSTWMDSTGMQRRRQSTQSKENEDPKKPLPPEIQKCIGALLDKYVGSWPKCPLQGFSSKRWCYSVLIRCMIFCESKDVPDAKNQEGSSAFGYFQILKLHEGRTVPCCKKNPNTGKMEIRPCEANRSDPCENISLGIAILSDGLRTGIKGQYKCWGTADFNRCVRAYR